MKHTDRSTARWFKIGLTILLTLGLLAITSLAGAQPRLTPAGVINHACPDSYELDDFDFNAVELLTSTAQVHNFDGNTNTGISDKDWTRFKVVPFSTYTLTTYDLSNQTDTVLDLYDDANNLFASNDDSGASDHGSQIVWQAPLTASGWYYLAATNNPRTSSAYANCSGTVVSYTLALQVKQPRIQYLPVIMRNY